MLSNKILKKLLAIVLIFTLTFTNFAFVTKSYASTLAEALFGEIAKDTGHENVEFEAYFGTEEDMVSSVISDVNNQELAINAKLSIKESGYLKDAEIAIKEYDEGKGLNFRVKEIEELPESIQSLEDNVLKLHQIDSFSDGIEVTVPIEYKYEKYYNDENLSKDFLIVLSGIYVDNEGEENEISKEIKLNVSWKDERAVKVETEATKYIDYGNGIILQTIVKIDSTTDQNALPVKESEVNINVPKIGDATPNRIDVVANSTLGTNGKSVGEVVFSQDDWSYNQEENRLTIVARNEKELVIVNEFEDEFLQDAEQELIEEERYYNVPGVDEYLITYTFENADMTEEIIYSNSNIEAKLTTFSGVAKEEMINIATANEEFEYALDGKIGDMVSLKIENETENVSKAPLYVNYNHSEKYETELKSKIMVNVSYKEIIEILNVEDVENLYVDKAGNVYQNNDIYYKQIVIAKENFANILGENGEIKVLDLEGNELAKINNETTVDEDGNIIINFEERNSKLNFEFTKPIAEGNLVIGTLKAIKNATIDKETLANVTNVITRTAIKAKYDYVDEKQEVEVAECATNFENTITKATLLMDRNNLSTVTMNNDVELKIELNNAVESSDVYGHSVFDIELPETVEKIEVTNYSLMYGEGLTITSVEVLDRTIRVTLDGVQDGINSGVLSNGTNILLNVNIKVNVFTPAKEATMKLKYTNAESTNYDNDGYSEYKFEYSAPTGLVALTSISNYDNNGSYIMSIGENEKLDLLDIYLPDVKVAKNEIVIMNNNENTVSDVVILGRIPVKGVKDLLTGNDLGTTLDTKLINGIVPDGMNNQEFTIYYSTNVDATRDLNDTNNGWTENPENFAEVKSFLLVPVSEDYEMAQSDVLRFTYEYEIPANLTHNEYLYGTFGVYYINNLEFTEPKEEVSVSDLVGLTTGVGPELELDVSVDKTEVKEFEYFEAKVIVKNVGEHKAEEVRAEVVIPNYVTLVTEESSSATNGKEILIDKANNQVIATDSELFQGEELEFTVRFRQEEITDMKLDETVIEEGENLNINQVEASNMVGSSIEDELFTEIVVNLNAKDLNTTISDKETIKVLEAELGIDEQNNSDLNNKLGVQTPGCKVTFSILVKNLKDEKINNLVVTKELPQEFDFEKAYELVLDEETMFTTEGNLASFDEATRIITWNIPEIAAKNQAELRLIVVVNELADNLTKVDVATSTKATADGTSTYESNQVVTTVGMPKLETTQTSTITDSYIQEGDSIEYQYRIKNTGGAIASNISFVDNIPDGLKVIKATYKIGVIEDTINSSYKNQLKISSLNLPAGDELIIDIKAVASNLDGLQEKTIKHYATISGKDIEKFDTDSITHIVKISDKKLAAGETYESTQKPTLSEEDNIVKTYKVTGTAWVDSNKDGMRNNNEELVSGVAVKLVNSVDGTILKSATTDTNGTYTFPGIKNGTYLVLFDYDTVKYTVTAYQKDGVSGDVNSDAFTTEIEQNGKTRNAAITDTITVSNGTVSGIDIGFALADKFDLELTKTITKVITQTAEETTTDEYNNVDMAKTDIAAKYLAGSTVYVEYQITVTNKGEIAGYAKKIIDYLPADMVFNSSLESNANWYTGTDGNLYNEELANIELAPGQSKTIKLVLSRQMTEDNTDIIHNIAEIYDDYNIYGVSDYNSTPGNKAQKENDQSSADLAIMIKTGETYIYVSVIATIASVACIVIVIAFNKIVLRRKKGGA